MSRAEPVRLFLAADRTLFRHLPAVIGSASEVTSRPLEIGIVVDGVGASAQKKLSRRCPQVSLHFFQVDATVFAGLPTIWRLSTFVYARLLMPSLVEWDRFIYLDVDMLVRRDLSDLYDTPLQGAPAAAAFNNRGGTLNSGVLLIDAAAWRSRGLIDEMLDFARTNAPVDADQATIDAVIGAEMLRLDPQWNTMVDSVWGRAALDESELLARGWILHFITGFKPWNLGRFKIPAQLLAEWDRYANPKGLPRNLGTEARLLLWQLAMLWRQRRHRQ